MSEEFTNLPPFPTVLGSESYDIPQDFYRPLLSRAVTFDRVAGYFSSVAFLLTWPGLRKFVQRQGRMRVICSPHISRQDAEGLLLGYASEEDEYLSSTLMTELNEMLESDQMSAPARLLAALLSSGNLDLRLARVERSIGGSDLRLFHDKFGVFSDSRGNRVGFSGSLNETFSALAGVESRGNLESIAVLTSWDEGRDAERLNIYSNRFEAFWSGSHASVRLTRLPTTFREHLENLAGEVTLDDAIAEMERRTSRGNVSATDNLQLFPHQMKALDAWRQNRFRGVLEHATGSGKTRTGVAAAACLRAEELAHSLVLVPSRLLMYQWESEFRDLLGIHPLLCGDGHNEWRQDNLLPSFLRSANPMVVIAIGDTASSPAFVDVIDRYAKRLFIIGDEVHRFGAERYESFLKRVDAAFRLGLSATPKRFGDERGTRQIHDFFGDTIDKFSLKDAITAGRLVPYWYHTHQVALNEAERETYQELTSKIRRLVAQLRTDDGIRPSRQLDMLRLSRARVIKQASHKLRVAVSVLTKEYLAPSRWLVYCDTVDELVQLQSQLKAAGLASMVYHSAMQADADMTLELFRVHGGIILSVRCLDEGVDIPAADHALICSSSQNPREFIQRRGRILRRDGLKQVAYLHDLIVVPGIEQPKVEDWSFLLAEMGRAFAFARDAENREAELRLLETWRSLGLDLDDLVRVAEEGVEDDDGGLA